MIHVQRALVCEPRYFDVAYSINRWMDVTRRVEPQRALAQWDALCRTMTDAGATLDYLEPVAGLPDMPFASDSGLARGRTYLQGRFRHIERRPETALHSAWFAQNRFRIATIPEGLFFEGAADAIVCGDEYVLCHGPRTSRGVQAVIDAVFPDLQCRGCFALRAPFYHGGLSIAFLKPDVVACAPAAFGAEDLATIRASFSHVIEVSDEDALEHMACCQIVIGNTIIVGGGSDRFRSAVRAHGFEVALVDLSEFKKAGAGAACLALPLPSRTSD